MVTCVVVGEYSQESSAHARLCLLGTLRGLVASVTCWVRCVLVRLRPLLTCAVNRAVYWCL